MPTITELLADARAQLGGDEVDSEAQLLLEEACGINRSERFTNPHRSVDADSAARFYDWLQRRISGEPLAYITGRRAFWDLELDITPEVLIPRADTEILVEQALAHIPPQADWQIADQRPHDRADSPTNHKPDGATVARFELTTNIN